MTTKKTARADQRASSRTRAAIRSELKTGGPQTAAALAETLGVSAMAARQHLYEMCDQGLVDVDERAEGRGRPAKYWRLTPDADAYFPDAHADLALDLIGAMKDAFGARGLDKLLDARTRQQKAAYNEEISPRTSLKGRLDALAAIRSREGYMAAVEKTSDGYLLIENHCPICSAARACSGLCARELEVFQDALGADAKVERTEHILAGARRCAYKVTRAAKAPRG